MTWTPPPGTIGLTYSYGFTAFRATLGQTLINETTSYSHAFIAIGDGLIIEPWPNGVRLSALDDYAEEDVSYGLLMGLNDSQRQAVVSAALTLDGVGHGLADYLALAVRRWRWNVPWAHRRAASSARLLPAQFVAEAYRRAGMELMPGFSLGDVTMSDLGALFIESPAWEMRRPCVEVGWTRHAY